MKKRQKHIRVGNSLLVCFLFGFLLSACSRLSPTPLTTTAGLPSIETTPLSSVSGLLYSVRTPEEGRLCYFDDNGASLCPFVLSSTGLAAAKWSPGKSWIAYLTTTSNGRYSLWVARSDGSEQMALVEEAPYVVFSWELDSLRLDYSIFNSYDPHAYDPLQDERFVTDLADFTTIQVANRCDEAYTVYARAGGEIPQDEFLDRCKYHQINWSPDRSQLAIRTYTLGGGEGVMRLQLIHISANRLLQVELPYPQVWFGDWAPDNRWMSLTMEGEGLNSNDIFILDGDTLDLKRYTTFGDVSTTGVSAPIWSPDGEWLSFLGPDVSRCLYVIRRDGSEQRQLACGLAGNTMFWSPDSRWIAFESMDDAEDRRDIRVVSIAGGPPQRLTKDGIPTIRDWR
jgi:Tol biopolymer transport system component